jgi:hypothetical protein
MTIGASVMPPTTTMASGFCTGRENVAGVDALDPPGDSRNEVVLRLHHVGRLDGEQELAAPDDVAGLAKSLMSRPE